MPTVSNAVSSSKPLDYFQQALDQYRKQVIAPSSKNDQKILQHATAQDAVEEIKLAERKCARESRTRKCLDRMQHFIFLLDRYGAIVDTCVQYDPAPSALIWGGLRLVIKVEEVVFTV